MQDNKGELPPSKEISPQIITQFELWVKNEKRLATITRTINQGQPQYGVKIQPDAKNLPHERFIDFGLVSVNSEDDFVCHVLGNGDYEVINMENPDINYVNLPDKSQYMEADILEGISHALVAPHRVDELSTAVVLVRDKDIPLRMHLTNCPTHG